jgi:predicted MFS family arabinose efflux permease
MVSFGNAGVTLGTFLGGIIITRFGIHEVIWISILLLIASLVLTFVFIRQKQVESKEIKEESAINESVELSPVGQMV